MIKAEQLTKAFGSKVAVNGVSFTVERGEVLGFLGPNGAGKSTTMRMITGFIPPSSGKTSVGGHDLTNEPISARPPTLVSPNSNSNSAATRRAFSKSAATASVRSSGGRLMPPEILSDARGSKG